MESSHKGPGIYHGVPFSEYIAHPGVNSSALTELRRSPAHMQAYRNREHEFTKAFQIGEAVHRAVLEPDLFLSSYVQGPEGNRTTKAVRDAWNALADEYGAEYVLSPDDYAMCLAMRDSVLASVSGRQLLASPGASEVMIVWQDEGTGLLCKGRIDRLPDESVFFVDLKTTTDAHPRAFQKSLWAYGYFRQAAFYSSGLQALGEFRPECAFVAVEKSLPYAVSVMRLDHGAMDAGAHENRILLQRYAECEELGYWPGYTESIQDLALPPWAFSEILQAPGISNTGI